MTVATAILIASLGQPQAQAADLHARPALVAETLTAAPGETLWLALDFELDPGWHTYWPGQNDSGFALDAQFTCSDDAEVGEPLWPAPHRHTATEGILDHVFEERMTVLVPVQVSESARAGDRVSIEADMRWLVCETMCIAESAVESISLPVVTGEPKPDPKTLAAFAAARARLPLPVEEGQDIQIECAGDLLRVRAIGAARLAFYPLDGGRRARNLIDDGMREGETLELEFRPGGDPVRGVLEVWSSAEGPSTVFEIHCPVPGALDEAKPGG